MRVDGKLKLSEVDPFDRVLLLSDGTLTHVIEAHALEPIGLVPLAQTLTRARRAIRSLDLKKSEALIEREILLRGVCSGHHYLFASSQIAADRLDREFRKQLLAAKLPIGVLWKKLRIETYKEILRMGRRPAADLAEHFGGDATQPLLFRRYRVFSHGRPAMIITEAFPVTGAHASAMVIEDHPTGR